MSRKKYVVKVGGEKREIPEMNYVKLSKITDLIADALEASGEPLAIIQRAQEEILEKKLTDLEKSKSIITAEDFNSADKKDQKELLEIHDLETDYFEKNEELVLVPANASLDIGNQEIITHLLPFLIRNYKPALEEASAIIISPSEDYVRSAKAGEMNLEHYINDYKFDLMSECSPDEFTENINICLEFILPHLTQSQSNLGKLTARMGLTEEETKEEGGNGADEESAEKK